jgi:hypothetical protein
MVKNLSEPFKQPVVTPHTALKGISNCLLGKMTAVDTPVICDVTSLYSQIEYSDS